MKLIQNHWYKFNDNGEIHIGYFLGRQPGFECCVCGKGTNAYTFNIWNSDIDYETWGYGKEHLPKDKYKIYLQVKGELQTTKKYIDISAVN